MAKYYIDNVHGRDDNEGIFADIPWKTIEKAHEKRYEPGDEILFIRGGYWKGMFTPAGDGEKDAPIKIGSYGNGPLPWIDGAGAQAAVKLDRVDYWTVSGIKCTNAAPERFPRCGIMVMGRSAGVTKGIRIENCEVCNVKGENRRPLPRYRNMYNNSGIYITFPYRCTEENHLDDIVIENNHVHDVFTSGIRINQEEDGQTDIFHTNVIIRGNLIERTGTDAIIAANSVKPLIEYNRCYDAGALGVKDETIVIAGVWCCACSDATFQYNEVARTRLFHNDGTAFDTDWGVTGVTTFRNNYTHDNEGGFWLDCTALRPMPDCKGTVLSGNVSINDHWCIAQSEMGVDTLFENNLFINIDDKFEICGRANGKAHRYVNNTLYFKNRPTEGWQESSYDGNAYNPDARNDADKNAKKADAHWLEVIGNAGDLDGKEELFGLSFTNK